MMDRWHSLFRCGKAAESGQSIIESAITMALICLIFMGAFQISQLIAAREVLHHASARGARARTVGFNRWMVRKCVNIASIPNAGRMRQPQLDRNDRGRTIPEGTSPGDAFMMLLGRTPAAGRYHAEMARIPEYLASENNLRARQILDYEGWDTIDRSINEDGVRLNVSVSQTHTNWLWGPVHRAYYAADSLRLNASSSLENHYSLYMDNENW